MTKAVIFLAACTLLNGQIQDGPQLPYKVVESWPQLPSGWNFGEVAAVDVDRDDNVWVLSDGPHPVMQFDGRSRKLNQRCIATKFNRKR